MSSEDLGPASSEVRLCHVMPVAWCTLWPWPCAWCCGACTAPGPPDCACCAGCPAEGLAGPPAAVCPSSTASPTGPGWAGWEGPGAGDPTVGSIWAMRGSGTGTGLGPCRNGGTAAVDAAISCVAARPRILTTASSWSLPPSPSSSSLTTGRPPPPPLPRSGCCPGPCAEDLSAASDPSKLGLALGLPPCCCRTSAPPSQKPPSLPWLTELSSPKTSPSASAASSGAT